MTLQLPELLLPPDRLRALDQAIRDFLSGGPPGAFRIIGAGELTCVVEWEGRACKRLPPVHEARRTERYGALLAAYLQALSDAGVPVVETAFQSVCAHQEHIGYILQPSLPPESLLPPLMQAMGADEVMHHFRTILGHVESCVAAGIGIDPQISNWALREGHPILLDVTTPMLRDEKGIDLLDTDLFVAMLPVLIQGVVRRYMVQDLLNKNFQRRLILLDLVGNVVNYGLGRYTGPFLEEANGLLTEEGPLSLGEVESYRRGEKWTWWAMRKAFSAEQLWRRRVLRTPALHLLPSQFKG